MEVREDVPLREYTTLRIGGPARYFCAVRSARELGAALAAARAEGLEVLVLGGGSNLLVLDGGIDGLVIHNRMEGLDIDGTRVRAASGESFGRLIERLADAGLAGLGFAAGVPGTVGGAVRGNAGCYGQAIGDVVEAVELVRPDGSGRRAAGADALGFGYRHSALGASGELVEAVVLRLTPGDPEALRREIAENLATRAERHPPADLPSAGSYFRNLPPGRPGERRIAAGLLLDETGCKGLRVGDAAVFEHHANMIVNLGRATAADVLELAEEMKARVRGRFGVTLCEEVRQAGVP